LRKELHIHYPNSDNELWHWKCPTSAYFLPFWNSIFPDAYYIHIVRDKYDVAESLMRRKEFRNITSALANTEKMNTLISSFKFNNYLRVDYNNFPTAIDEIRDFIPNLSKETSKAKAIFKTKVVKPFMWKSNKSVRHNLWSAYISLRIIMHRIIGL